MKVYLVGGAVRDELMGLPVQERDWVVVGAAPIDMIGLGYQSVAKHFPVFLHPETKEEYALARTERKVHGGYHGFTFDTATYVTLEEDLRRRDLTINAMAKTEDNQIIDPYGGQDDLRHKVLRHVSGAFVEDPVRVLRVARFASRFVPYGFTIAPETMALMKQMVENGECDFLIPERIWKELARGLGEAAPVAFIQTLRACGALKKILPEVDKLYGVPQSPRWHPEVDTGVHMELVLTQATRLTSDPKIRFAALVHDLGKGITDPTDWPDHPEHEIKGVNLLKELCNRLKVPHDYQDLAYCVTRFHGDYYQLVNQDPEGVLQLLEHLDAFRRVERCREFMVACLADLRGRPGYEEHIHPSQIRLEKALVAAMGIDTQAVIAQLPTKEGSKIKEAIRQARLEAIAEVR